MANEINASMPQTEEEQPKTPKPGENWVAVGGNWVPPDHPMAQQAPKPPSQGPDWRPVPGALGTPEEAPVPYGDDMRTGVDPGQPPSAQPTAPGGQWNGGGDMTPDQARAAGLSWVPKDHPLYGTAGFVGSGAAPGGGAPGSTPTNASGAYVPPNAAPGTPGANPVDTQGKNAQTYSQTPGAAPADATTNQGTQDVWRNKLLQMATQGTDVDMNDPTIRNESDAFRAQLTRTARDLQNQQAEEAGPLGQSFARGEQRSTAAKASQAAAGFEAQLAGRELQNKRDEIKSALASLGAGIENDQRRALEKKLGELNASIQKLGIESGAATAASELALKGELGRGGLNVDLMRALLQNQQFGNELGFNIADREAYYNNAALNSLLK